MKRLIKGINSSTQELSEKVNEIVEWINKKGLGLEARDEIETSLGCRKHGRLFCSECDGVVEQHPDFEKWRRDCIETAVYAGRDYDNNRDLFLTVAPEDFYIIQNGARKEYFTWDEAMELEKKVLKPNGWRLPTCKELAQLCACYIDDKGSDDVERFMKELNAERRGDMDTNGSIGNVGSYGLWWSSTASSAAYARGLLFNSGYFYPQDGYYKGYGFAVRCVAQ